MIKKIVILGAGGHAREVVDLLIACNERKREYEILGYIDENHENIGKKLNGFNVLGDFSWFDAVNKTEVSVVAGIGNPASKKKMVEKASQKGLQFCSVIHPSAVLTPFVRMGQGIVITAGSILTNQIVIGSHAFINLNCTVSHDSEVEDYCNINPGVHISGNVHIGIGTEIGTGAAIIQGIKIGPWSVIGAGAVVTCDIPGNVTAVGVPARIIKERGEQL